MITNTLHIFGCSYSEPFNKGYDPYVKWKGYEPKSWTEILAEKLNLNLNNHAKGGNSNEMILQNFCKSIHTFKKNDVVILQWSFLNRFTWINTKDEMVSCSYRGIDKTLDQSISELISVTRSSNPYKLQLLDYQKLIDDYCKVKGIDIWYWHADPQMYEYVDLRDMRYLIIDEIMENNTNFERCTFDVVYGLGGYDIETETNGELNDSHFSESAHKIKGELFYNHIKKYKNKLELLYLL